MSTLSTHVLDTSHGIPASGMTITLVGSKGVIASAVTNSDGRCPDLVSQSLAPDRYRLEFDVARYFRARQVALADPPFFDVVSIDFGISEGGGHYHVPLLVSPYSYSTYRGS
jgi:5-hydroxyisourate hydrolase